MPKTERKSKPVKAADAAGAAAGKRKAPQAAAARRREARGPIFRNQRLVRMAKQNIGPGLKMQKKAVAVLAVFAEQRGLRRARALHALTKHAGRQTSMAKDLEVLHAVNLS
jgi:histone H3/H4